MKIVVKSANSDGVKSSGVVYDYIMYKNRKIICINACEKKRKEKNAARKGERDDDAIVSVALRPKPS